MVRPGDSPSIRCEVAEGDQPITITWTRQGEAGLPLTVSQSGELLQFLNIAVSDEGRYVCTASNAVGSSEATAKVIVAFGGLNYNKYKPPAEAGQVGQFRGCIVDLEISGRKVDMLAEAVDSTNIEDCQSAELDLDYF